MPDAQTRDADLVVVGAGLAGLSAARAAAAAGASVVVVEARERVGGRVLNEEIRDGIVVEVGGQWIGPTQDRLAALARGLGVQTFPTYGEGENVFEYGGRLRRYRGTIPRINPLVLLDVERAQRRLNRLARRVPLDAPWEAPNAAVLDGQTTATWMRRNLATKPGRMLLELGVESVWAAQPEDMSLLHVLFYIHSAGSLEMLFDTEGGAQQDRFVGGSQRIALLMAQALGPERLILGAPVRKIQRGEHGVTVEADGAVVRARRAIVAVAPTLAGRIAYDPPLPGFRDQLTQRMPLGTVAKCMAIYDQPFWRGEGLSGQATSDTGPVKLAFDNSPPGGSPGVLLGFVEGRRARELGRLPAEQRRAAVVDCFARLFGPRSARPDAYVERLWAEEEWSRGCYGCHMPTGAWTNYGPALREPIGPLQLGRRRVRDRLERLHGRRRAVRRGRGRRRARAALESRLAARAPGIPVRKDSTKELKMSNRLQGKKVAFLAADGVEQVELTEPWKAVEDEAARPNWFRWRAARSKASTTSTRPTSSRSTARSRRPRRTTNDGLVLPGGVANPDFLRANEDAVRFVRSFFEAGKPAAVICHGPWMLVEADAVRGRKVTSWPSVQTDIRNAGGDWVDEEVVVDNGLVTSRQPDDLPAFCSKLVEEICEGRHEQQAPADRGRR